MEEVKFTPEIEVALFRAMQDHKPVGVSKHWHMVCIHQRMIAQGFASISTHVIWNHLQKLYDLVSLDELENDALPSDQQDFELPPHFHEQGDSEDVLATRKRGRGSNSPSPSVSPHRTSKRKRTQ